jgi:hypothetical protein
MMYYSKIADRDTYDSIIKKVAGRAMILVATKTSRRTLRRGKTQYIFSREGTEGIYYNESRNGVLFVPMARKESNMKRHYDLYCAEPLNRAELEYLKLHPHIRLVG